MCNIFTQPRFWFLVLLIIDVIQLFIHRQVFFSSQIFHQLPTSFYFLNNVVHVREIPQWLPDVGQGIEAGRGYLSTTSLMQGVYFLIAPLVKGFNYIDLYILSIVVDRLIFIVGLWCLTAVLFKRLISRVGVMLVVLTFLLPIYQPDHGWYVFYVLPLVIYFVQRYAHYRFNKYLFLAVVFVLIQGMGYYRTSTIDTSKKLSMDRAQFVFQQQSFHMRHPQGLKNNSQPLAMNPIAMPVWSAVTSDKVMMFNRVAKCPDIDTVSFFMRHGDYRGYIPFMVDRHAHMVQDCLSNLTADRRMNAYPDVFRYSANHVVLSVDNPQDGWLVFTDRWHPSWRATVDNEEVKVAQVNLMYKMIPVSKGIHVIEFSFFNQWIALMQWVLSMVMLGVILVVIKMTLELVILRL